MNFEDMQNIQEELFEKIQKIRETKGREYAHDEETLADFYEVAAEAGITPMQCWLVYERKHSRAIGTYVKEGTTRSESIDDRILDVVVYHILLLGLIKDRERELKAASLGPARLPLSMDMNAGRSAAQRWPVDHDLTRRPDVHPVD